MFCSNSKFISAVIFAILLFGFFNANSKAQMITPDQKIVTCPSSPDSNELPNFSATNCYESTLATIDPQNKEIWIQLKLQVDNNYLEQTVPMALYINGKTSSLAYLNGNYIGGNGNPGSSGSTESPGFMDAVFFIDKSQIQQGENQLILKMSSHHGFFKLARPISSIRISSYRNPTHEILRHYWLSLLPFGVFVISALFLGILSRKHVNKAPLLFLVLMSLFAACQLLIETSRGFWQYPYPFHDTRLLLIVCFSFGFGMNLLAYVAHKFSTKRLWSYITGGFVVSLAVIYYARGFDLKASLGILIPSLIATIVCVIAMVNKKPQAGRMALVLLIFSVFFILDISRFLDSYFYYVVAILMLILIAQQAIDFASEKEKRLLEKARADQLQLIIDQNNEEVARSTIKIIGAGTVEKISINQIAYCKGAGDYVELVLLDKSNILHNTSLRELESTLPNTFLKVHRSYIVNTAQITSLERVASGTGKLLLSNGLNVPVSRRIMPHVRQKLI